MAKSRISPKFQLKGEIWISFVKTVTKFQTAFLDEAKLTPMHESQNFDSSTTSFGQILGKIHYC